jgi:hypothetical protein
MPGPYDFAILGDGALSALLAGLLAHDHGKRVLHVAAAASPQRLPRHIGLALTLATRPETWRLLRRAEAETIALLAALEAQKTVTPSAVRIIPDLAATKTALAHMSHVARGYGLSIHDGNLPQVSRLAGDISLADSKVTSVPPDAVELRFGKAGAATLFRNGEPVDVGQIVLADDGAIFDHLPEAQRPAQLAAQPMIATLTDPARRLAAPVMLFPDRGVTLAQRPDGTVLALITSAADVEARLASCLSGPFPLRRTATAHFRRLVTADGAPLIGRLKPSRLMIIAGLGEMAPFLAPPLARQIAGVADETEKSWFAAHSPSRTSRDSVADFAPMAAA